MVRRNGEEADEIPIPVGSIPVCSGTARSADAQGVNRIYGWWWLETADFLPLEALVAVELNPSELANLVEGIHGCMPFGFLQREQIVLKHGVVEVQPNRCFIAGHDQVASE